LRGGVLPSERIDQVVHILFEELVDHTQGIFVWRRIEIEGATQEMMGRIGDEELLGRGGIAADAEKDAAYPVAGDEGGVFDGAGLIGVFEGELVGVVAQFIELVWTNDLIADVDARAEAGKVDIDPPGIWSDGVEIGAVLQDVGVYGVFEGIGVAGLVEGAIFMGREINLKITAAFGSIDRIAGINKSQE